MVTIRLARHGRKKRPFYRIVAADKRRAATGKFLEVLGTYDPAADPAVFTVEKERYSYWVGKGASVSDTVASLYKKFGEKN
ncbi:MAG: 30S ribosomal protein S16 [Fibrobacterota bacterium]